MTPSRISNFVNHSTEHWISIGLFLGRMKLFFFRCWYSAGKTLSALLFPFFHKPVNFTSSPWKPLVVVVFVVACLGRKRKLCRKTPKRNFTINTFYPSRLASENEIFLPFNAPGRRIFPFLSSSQLLPPLKKINNFHLLFPLVRQPMRRRMATFVGSGLLAAGFAIDWGLTKAQEMSRTDRSDSLPFRGGGRGRSERRISTQFGHSIDYDSSTSTKCIHLRTDFNPHQKTEHFSSCFESIARN